MFGQSRWLYRGGTALKTGEVVGGDMLGLEVRVRGQCVLEWLPLVPLPLQEKACLVI